MSQYIIQAILVPQHKILTYPETIALSDTASLTFTETSDSFKL